MAAVQVIHRLNARLMAVVLAVHRLVVLDLQVARSAGWSPATGLDNLLKANICFRVLAPSEEARILLENEHSFTVLTNQSVHLKGHLTVHYVACS